MQRKIIPVGLVLLATGCMSVPELVSTDSICRSYAGKKETVLINQYGLPDLSMSDEYNGKICSWNLGTTTQSSGAYGGGTFFGTSAGSARKMTAYIDSTGTITRVNTNGCYLGNEAAVHQAENHNRLVSMSIFLGGVVTFLTWISS